jgi:short-subunit dehydrogenase
MRKTLIIGATSAIAQATARLFAAAGDALFLVARNSAKLSANADDLKVRGASVVHTATLDVLDYDQHKPVIDAAVATLDGLDLVLISHGTLPDQKACEQSFYLTRKEFEINALSTISLLTHLANYFEQQKRGTIVVVSSVAGDRGRQSNYVYGSAKGAISIFLQGLRNRLYRSGVNVLTVKPGFVDTPMTSGFKKGPLWSTPRFIAKDISRAISSSGREIYSPAVWRLIMIIILFIPEWLFKRLRL